MPDLLVPLFNLPEMGDTEGIWTGRPLPHQSPAVLSFVRDTFSKGWEAEARTAFGGVPPTILVSVDEGSGDILGFCCWDCTARGFLGPVGVAREARGRGVGRSLVLSCLGSMRESGYGYAIIGDAGPVDFFRRICDARIIQGSSPGIYGNPLSD